MKKYILDMKVTENCHLHKNYCLLKLTSDGNLPEMLPGQFVEVHVENSPTTFLRRPISVSSLRIRFSRSFTSSKENPVDWAITAGSAQKSYLFARLPEPRPFAMKGTREG